MIHMCTDRAHSVRRSHTLDLFFVHVKSFRDAVSQPSRNTCVRPVRHPASKRRLHSSLHLGVFLRKGVIRGSERQVHSGSNPRHVGNDDQRDPVVPGSLAPKRVANLRGAGPILAQDKDKEPGSGSEACIVRGGVRGCRSGRPRTGGVVCACERPLRKTVITVVFVRSMEADGPRVDHS